MQIGISRRWAAALVLATATAMSYAQWTNPADDIPAYHPSAPLKVSSLPPILSGAKLTETSILHAKHLIESSR